MVVARDYMAREATKILQEYEQGKITRRQALDFLYCTGYKAREAMQELQFVHERAQKNKEGHYVEC